MTTPLPIFDPPEEITRKLLRALVDPSKSLTMLADEYDTDLDSLCAWMARSDIRERFHNFRSACAERTRAAAENCLTMVVQTAHAVIHEFHDDQHHMGFKPITPQGHEVKRRNRETALRAGRLLMSLAKYHSLDLAAVARASGRVSPRSRGPHQNNPTPIARNASSELPTSDFPPPTSASDPALHAILTNPHLAAHLAALIAAHQATTPVAGAGAAAPATPPDPNSQSPRSGRNTLSPGRQPRDTAAPTPKPAERAKQPSDTTPESTTSSPLRPNPSGPNPHPLPNPNLPPSTPVPLTISARPRAP